jgi:hypothetical protein
MFMYGDKECKGGKRHLFQWVPQSLSLGVQQLDAKLIIHLYL